MSNALRHLSFDPWGLGKGSIRFYKGTIGIRVCGIRVLLLKGSWDRVISKVTVHITTYTNPQLRYS